MAKVDSQTLQTIKSRLDLVEIIRRYVDLRPLGGRFVGNCPFHHETKPSFNVHPEQGFYHCFGCQASGDAIDFFCRINGLDFKDGIAQLAAETGVQLGRGEVDPSEKRQQELVKMCRDVHGLAAEFFRQNLLSRLGSPAREYVARRKMDPAIVERFGLGYGLDEWQSLTNFLQSKGYTAEQGVTAGLLSKNDKGRIYDRFRGRLIFPIQSLTGQVVAFGGRIIGDGDPKYLNSSDTPIYKKGDHLYGLHQARPMVSKVKRTLLTEGYVDVLALHQFGYGHSVGVLGTALTSEQVKRLSGFCTRVDLVFDGDAAGRKAALRSACMLLSQGLSCRVILLPEGEDIDSFLHSQGKERFDALLEQAVDGLEFCVATVKRDGSAREVTDWARDFLRGLKDQSWQAFFIPRLAAGLGLAEAELRRMMFQVQEKVTPVRTTENPRIEKATTDAGVARAETQDRFILQFVVCHLRLIPEMIDRGYAALLMTEWAKNLWGKLANNPEQEIFSLLDATEKIFWAECHFRETQDEEAERQEWEDFSACMDRQVLKARKEEAIKNMRQAQALMDGERSLELLKANADSLGREE